MGGRILRSKAPLRISFAGGGTDVDPFPRERGGAVLSVTINKYAYASLDPSSEPGVQVESLDYDVVAKYRTEEDLRFDGNLDLVKAVLQAMGRDEAPPRAAAARGGATGPLTALLTGEAPPRRAPAEPGLRIFLHSDAPPGSGLGSSSTLVVALLGLLARHRRHPFTDYELAELAWRIEREDLGIRGGKQDQYAAAFGGFNFIEFHPDAVVVNPLRMDQETLNELEYSLLLCYTGGTRLSGRILERQIASYVERRAGVVEALEAQKALAVALKNALLRRQLWDFGGLLHEAWETKKRLDQGISNPRIDEMYDEARRAGAVGGKLLGAGGGGYLLLYCRFDRKHRVAETLERLGGQVVEFGFESRGLQTWEAAA